MSIVQNVLIGSARKKIGNAVFLRLKGQNILRSKPLTVAQPVTDLKTMRQSAFRQIVAMYRIAAAVINLSYTPNKEKQSSYNSFVSDNLRDAFDYSVPPDATLIAANVLYSKGTITPTPILLVTGDISVGTVAVTWDTPLTGVGQNADDIPVIVIFNFDKTTWTAIDGAGVATRATGALSIPNLVTDAVGNDGNAYLGFYNPTLKTASDSVQQPFEFVA